MLRRALLSSVAVIALATMPFATRTFAQPADPPQPPPQTNQGAHSSFFDDKMHGEPFGGDLVNMGAPPRTAVPQPYTTGDTAMDDTLGTPTDTSMTPVDSQGYYIETMPGYAQPAPVVGQPVADAAAPSGEPVNAPAAMADVGPATVATVVVVPSSRAVSPAEYVREASAGDLYEIQAGQLALQRSQSPEVRAVAQAMIDQHTQSTALLTQAAAQQGLAPVSELPAPKQAMLQRLRDAPDDQFDRLYTDQQVAAHMNAAALHEGFAQNGSGALQQAAIQIQPTVQTHLDHVYAMSDVPVSLASAKTAEDQQLADSGRGRTFRGYHVVGPTRGDTAGGMDRTVDTATTTGGGASDLSYGGSASRTGAMGSSGSNDLGRTTASTTAAPDVPDANGQLGQTGMNGQVNTGMSGMNGTGSTATGSSSNPTSATTPTAPTPGARVPVTPK